MNESTSVYNIFFPIWFFWDISYYAVPNPWITFLKKKRNLFFLCTHNVLQRVKQLLPQRKFSGINTIRQSSLSVKTCCGELLAAKLRTFYIVGNWGGCKCLAVQWKCTYTFLKWLYIITSSTQQKCVRSFSLSLFMPCGKMCLEMSHRLMIYGAVCFWCVSDSLHVQHRISVAAPRTDSSTIAHTHAHTRTDSQG